MSEAPMPVEVFCSYAHEDEVWLRKVETHLSLLQRQGLISLWHDRLIVPGADWAKTIDTHLETASVILLLVSADFLASNYCYGVEMKRALERQEAGEARVAIKAQGPPDTAVSPNTAYILQLEQIRDSIIGLGNERFPEMYVALRGFFCHLYSARPFSAAC